MATTIKRALDPARDDVAPVRLSEEAQAAKEMLVEHFRGRGGFPAALTQYRQAHPILSLEDAILGLFGDVCG